MNLILKRKLNQTGKNWGYDMNTKHFQTRSQQRGIPRGAQELLDRYGVLEYDGCGNRTVFINRVGKKKLEHEMGRAFVGRLGNLINVYRVESSSGDRIITTGFLTDRIRRH